MRFTLTLLLATVLSTCVLAQTENEPLRLNLQAVSITRADALSQIDQRLPVRIFFPADQLPAAPIALNLTNATVDEALDAILDETVLDYVGYRDQVYVIGSAITIGTEFDAAYFAAVAAQADGPEEEITASEGSASVGRRGQLETDGLALVRGIVTEQGSNDPLIGATIQVEGSPLGAATDVDGSYELRLRPGTYDLVVSYVGFGVDRRTVVVDGSGDYNITLGGGTTLQEVVVTEQGADANVDRVQASVERLDLAALEKLPTFMGETDVVRALLLNPGVSSIGEGATGFNVRGGEIDQNLLLMDNGALINSSHALGFFSTYNADVIKSVDLYKANMPARFGGRLASVLDVQLRDGSFDRLRGKASLGPVTAKLMLEGPIAKEKTSFIVGVRSSYADWVLNLASVAEVENSSTFFIDGNARITHRFNDNATLVLQGYGSQDDFVFNETFGFDYSTLMGQATYRQIVNERLYGSLNLVYSDYVSSQSDLREFRGEQIDNGVRYLTVKPIVNFDASERTSFEGGLEINRYWINPGERIPVGSESLAAAASLPEENGLESSIFLSVDQSFGDRFSLSGGLRYTDYRFLGPYSENQYPDGVPARENVIGQVEFGSGETVASYGVLQPRLSMRYRLSGTASIRAGYGRTAQFLNQIFVSDSPTPSSQFQLSTRYIPPFLSHNLSLGYFRNLEDNNVELGVEVYARDIDQLWDYRDFAEVIVNPTLETEILVGDGRAYGLELSGKRKIGTINGLVSYTFSATERRIPGINGGEFYRSNFDKPHNFVATINWNPNKRNTLTANFTYGTGRPVTAPVGSYRVENGLSVPVFSDRNGVRIPDYHRLDLAYTLGRSYNETQKYATSWTISLYNVYGRRNAFSVFYTQGADRSNIANQLAVLGTVFPAITFNIETR